MTRRSPDSSHTSSSSLRAGPSFSQDKFDRTQELSPPLKDTPVLQELETRLGQVFFRPLCPGDYERLKQCHRDSFPIDYEDSFFEQAVSSRSNTTSWAAVQQQGGQSVLVGFITAKYLRLQDCDPTDRAALDLGSRLLDGQEVVYILTLGVAEGTRRHGVAGQLLRLVLGRALARGCRSCFLHVIQYNVPAICFYLQQAFEHVATRAEFYCITSGRQPDPSRCMYDAFLFAYTLNEEGPISAMAYVNTAMLPFRSLVESWGGTCGSLLQSELVCSSSRARHKREDDALDSTWSGKSSWLHGLFSRS